MLRKRLTGASRIIALVQSIRDIQKKIRNFSLSYKLIRLPVRHLKKIIFESNPLQLYIERLKKQFFCFFSIAITATEI